MQVTVHVPASLRTFSADQPTVQVDLAEGTTLAGVFKRLHVTHPGIVERVLDEHGAVRQHVNVFVNSELIRLGDGLQTQVAHGAEVWIMPAVSGGR